MKIGTFALALLCAAGCFVACGKNAGAVTTTDTESRSATETESATETVTETDSTVEHLTGGWSYENASTEIPTSVRAMFDSVSADYAGDTLEPIAYLGSQVVAGANHALLCRTTTGKLYVAVIWQKTDGTAELLHVREFSAADVK